MYRKIIVSKKIRNTIDGRTEESSEQFYNPYAKIYQLYGTMLFEAINIGYEETIVIELRTCKKSKEMMNSPKDFEISYNSKIYQIFASDFKKGDDGIIQFKCYKVS